MRKSSPASRPLKKEMQREFDKYFYYSESVQSPPEDAKFLDGIYREARKGKVARVFREDFCGTFANCCEWVKLGPGREAHGVDLDPEPLEYGKAQYLSRLSPAEQKRVRIHKRDVLKPGMPQADLVCAMNFSYFIFKARQDLRRYFKNCLSSLAANGVLVLDCFGGSKCSEPNEEVTEHGDPAFDYYWDQDTFDPLTNEAMFYIHFKRRGEKKRTKVFTYDWRMWSPAELRDLLYEVGFSRVDFLWEGSTPDGEGDGEFRRVEHGEDCEAWICYILGLK